MDLQNNEVWDYFVNLIDETNYLLEGKIILFSNYIELISEQLRDGRIAVIPPNQDTVTIFDITRSRINTSKISIFLGFNDKYIPKITNDNDFFTEKEQQFLQEKDIALRSSSSFISKEESINLFSRLNKTEDEIFIFSSLSDKKNSKMYESIYFNIIYTKIFKNQIIENPYLILSEDHCLTIREKILLKHLENISLRKKKLIVAIYKI